MSLPSLKGWAPIRLFWRGSEPWVEWCYIGRRRFTDFFFEATIFQALDLPFNTLFRQQTPLSALEEWKSTSPGLEPTAFVFHASRCGSTLMAQLLAALPRTLVLSEPPPVDVLVRVPWRAPGTSLETRVVWLQWMVSALGQPGSGAERYYFIKFEPRSTLELGLVRSAFPKVPWIFAYRNPAEVLVSLINEPAPLTTPGFTIPDPLGIDPIQLGFIPGDEYAARMLGKLMESAVCHHDALCTLVNYEQLPEILWNGLARNLGMAIEAEDIERMQWQAGLHAKRPDEAFQSDTEKKCREAGERIELLAERWVMPHYLRLEEIRRGQAS